MAEAKTETVRPGRQEAKSERARKAFIEATIRSLAKQGYAETSLASVSRTAGYTKGALQHHFANKEDLVAATLNELISRTMKPLSKLRSKGAGYETVADGLKAAWERHVNTDAYRALLEILNTSRINKPFRRRISNDLMAWAEKMDTQSLETYEAVDGDDEDVVILLNMNRCFLRGLLLQELYGTNKQTSAVYLERWIEMISPMLKYRD